MLTARLTMPLEIACTMIFVVAGSSMLAAAKPNIVHIVADDLGYNDLGIRNGGKTFTPVIDDLIRNGVTLSSYYTFRVCAPTRASIMTGRYPWGVGYYDMSDDMHHCVDPKYQMTPAVLKSLGYETHAIGKYDVGFVLRHCLPTYRGFDDFFGYYTACTSDYWMHGAPGGSDALGHCNDIDFHDSVGANISGAVMHGPNSVNNTYDQVLFTERAVHHINAFAANQNTDGAASGLYIYLAYHNVHDTCSKNREKAGLGAPRDTVGALGGHRIELLTENLLRVASSCWAELRRCDQSCGCGGGVAVPGGAVRHDDPGHVEGAGCDDNRAGLRCWQRHGGAKGDGPLRQHGVDSRVRQRRTVAALDQRTSARWQGDAVGGRCACGGVCPLAAAPCRRARVGLPGHDAQQ
eukprot:m.326835 g.326835  ORF g.326835 m.326835 type:complete len:406 (+) comp20409_c0_seq11:213-1430(+)